MKVLGPDPSIRLKRLSLLLLFRIGIFFMHKFNNEVRMKNRQKLGCHRCLGTEHSYQENNRKVMNIRGDGAIKLYYMGEDQANSRIYEIICFVDLKWQAIGHQQSYVRI